MKEKKLVCLRELETLTGKNYRTLKKRLEKTPPESESAGALYYDPCVVLAEIYKHDYAPLAQEELAMFRILREKSEAKLADMKAKKLKLEIGQLKGNLIPVEDMERSWADMVSAFRAKILAVPSRSALILRGMTEVSEIESTLKDFVYEALEELSRYQGPAQTQCTEDRTDHSPAT